MRTIKDKSTLAELPFSSVETVGCHKKHRRTQPAVSIERCLWAFYSENARLFTRHTRKPKAFYVAPPLFYTSTHHFFTKRLPKVRICFVYMNSSTWSTRPTLGCRARSPSFLAHGNIFWQLSRNGNLHGSGMSHATTASPKPSFRAR